MEQRNTTKSMMTGGTYGDEKMSKQTELNETMTIKKSPADEYTRAIRNIGGSNND